MTMRAAWLFAPFALLAACAPADTPSENPTDLPPVYPPLANFQSQPLLALAEHALTQYFSADATSLPTTCLTVRPAALPAGQEEQLILRFSRLAPAGRCRVQGAGYVDAITDKPAAVVQIYDFACANAAQCTGWAMLPGQPTARYVMTFEGGAWRFAADRRVLAE